MEKVYYISNYLKYHYASNKTIGISKYRELMQTVGDKNPRNNKGKTPLHQAAKYGFFDLCKLILENTTNKNPEDNAGMTPFHYAAAAGNLKICKLMMPNIKDKNIRNFKGHFVFVLK